MIAVNSRRAGAATTEDERAEAVRGRWANLSDRSIDTLLGDALIGVSGNAVVWVGMITGSQRGDDGRVQFETRTPEPPEVTALQQVGVAVGREAPEWARWRRGQGNPVRLGPPLPGVTPVADVEPQDVVTVGGVTVTWLPNRSELRVDCPRGVKVVVWPR